MATQRVMFAFLLHSIIFTTCSAVRIAFFCNQLSERGTEVRTAAAEQHYLLLPFQSSCVMFLIIYQVAIYDYAHYSEEILKYQKPMVLYPKHARKNDAGTIQKFISRFSSDCVHGLENGWEDVDTLLHQEVRYANTKQNNKQWIVALISLLFF
jgi:hypothetical protein